MSSRVLSSPVIPSSALDSPPRIWMTRDQVLESQTRTTSTRKQDNVVSANTQPRARDRESWPQPGDEQSIPSRSVSPPYRNARYAPTSAPPLSDSQPPSRRAHNGPPGRLEDLVDTRSTQGGRGLEGRLASLVDPPYSDDVNRADLPPPPVRTRARASTRDEPPPLELVRTSRAERVPASWDRPETSAKEERGAVLKVHPERAALFGRQAEPAKLSEPELPSPEAYAEPMKTSKPVRIRRPPPSTNSTAPQEGYGPSTSSNAEPREMSQRNSRGSYRSEETPVTPILQTMPVDGLPRSSVIRRGGSLLERLTLNDTPPTVSPDLPSPSLRDRVEHNHEPIANSQLNVGMDAEYEENSKAVSGRSPRGSGGGGNGGRGRKRSGKPRRGNGRRGN